MSETLADTRPAQRPGDDARPGGAAITVALDCARPHRAPWRIGLAGADELILGRGERAVDRAEGGKVVRVSIPDERMSSVHARLSRRSGHWHVSDAGSKNGTFVAGAHAEGALRLGETELLETGRTFWYFRREAGAAAEGEAEADPGDRLATLQPTLAAELARAARLARAEVSVLLLGETGTGKEVVARAIHERSARTGAFVAVNCGALPAALIESELFGHVRGAFSGAEASQPGLIRAAAGGTLFLDEIGELRPSSQAALLRVLQEREVRPVGSVEPVPVDLRVVAATLRAPEQAIASGAFRSDLYARLAGAVVRLVPLRDRLEDLGLLIASLLERADAPATLRLERRAARALFTHAWPYNVRELDNALRAALAVADDDELTLEDLPDALAVAPSTAAPAARALDTDDRALRDQLEARLSEHRGNVAATARAMGKQPMQIYRWVRRLGIDLSRYRR